ncbi:asparagine synthase-related protein [Aureimonas populi]|uniref:asparagine synthase (glutamine-hydrolyzing) n=1 Tax=Aureimonas populi TaxID=1701758 RepID=A0ABW5CSD8_9HYPH|nr:asparagine synthase-related protein [Aureimonas populi]
METIAGLVCEDEARLGHESERLRRRLRLAGYPQAAIWAGEGCVLLRASRSHRSSPRAVACAGPVAVLGDLRLDEPGELARALGLAPATPQHELVGAAYGRWGVECCEHLRGDFAFALFDRAERHLFCARDSFGVRPFHFREEAGLFSFSSDPVLLSGGGFDPAYVGGFLAGIVEDERRTLDPLVMRLPPAHHLSRRNATTSVSRYWTLEPAPPPKPGEVVEAFRERFAQAVERRLVASGPAGVMLSGGLDSSSISAVAARLRRGQGRLAAFSLVYPEEPDTDESGFIEAVAASARLVSTRVDAGAVPPLEGVVEDMRRGGAFVDAPGSGKLRRLFAAAAGQGVGVLLDGHGGDEVVWNGYRRVLDLAGEGRWLRALAQVPGLSRMGGDDPLLLSAAVIEAAAPGNRFGGALRRLTRFYRSRFTPPMAAPSPDGLHLLAKGFVRETDLRQRVLDARRPPADRSDAAAHAAAIASPRTSFAFEALHRLSHGAGVETRYPFFDRDLVTFCLGLPSSEKLRAGWPRSIMRRAMEGELPDAVRWRRDKTDFGRSLARGLSRWHADLLRDAERDRDGAMAGFYDMDALRPLLGRIRQAPEGTTTVEAMLAWRAAYLHLWLTKGRNGDGTVGAH